MMPTQQVCTPERLAEMFASCQEEIISEWRSQAGRLLADLALDKPTITDHLPDVIAEITRDLELSRQGTLSPDRCRHHLKALLVCPSTVQHYR